MNQTHYDSVAAALYHQTDKLTENTIKNQIFQIELDLAKADSVEEKLALEQLLKFYKDKLIAYKRQRTIRRIIILVLGSIALICCYLVFRFNSDSQSAKVGHSSSSSSFSSVTASSSISSSSTTASSSSVNSTVPASAVGTWTGKLYSSNIVLTINEDGTITKTQDGYTVTDHISGYEQVGTNLYRLYSADGEEAISSLIFSGVGGINVRYASGIYISGNTLYPQLWQASTSNNFTYTITTNLALQRGTDTSSSSIDTTQLTAEQVEDWVLRTYLSSRSITTNTSDYFANVKTYNNLVYASVRKRTAPDTRIALYRINAKGELEEGNLDDTNWHVVSVSYSA